MIDKFESSKSSHAFFNFVKSLIGIAILDLPFAANQCGYVMAAIILLLISYGTIRTSMMLIKVADQSGLQTYSAITKNYLGNRVAKLMDTMLVGQQLFVCIAYIIFFSSFCARSFTYIDIKMDMAFNLLLSLILIVPLSLIRDLHFFHQTSTLGFLMAVFALCLISANSVQLIGTVDVEPIKLDGLFRFIGVGMLSYEGICTALSVRKSMVEQKDFQGVFMMSSFFCLIMYLGFIVINVLAYGNGLNSIILLNLDKSSISFIISLIYAISILLTYPVQIYPAFQVIEHRLAADGQKYYCVFIRLAITALLYLIAFFVPNFSLFLNLVGIVFGTFLQFVFPILLYWKHTQQLSKIELIENSTLLTLGLLASGFALYFSVIDLIK